MDEDERLAQALQQAEIDHAEAIAQWQQPMPKPEAAATASGRPHALADPQHLRAGWAPGAGLVDTSADEALARSLQEHLDSELACNPRSSPQPASPHPGRGAAQPPTLEPPPAQAGFPGLRWLREQGTDRCAGCGRGLAGWGDGAYVSSRGAKWHPQCFACGQCGQAIPASQGHVTEPGSCQPFHARCYQECFGLRCTVCRDLLPAQADGRIRYLQSPFWRAPYCATHQSDGTPVCEGCGRLRPASAEWAALCDGRTLCLECLASVVVDTADAQPLYAAVVAFFRGMGLALPSPPPPLVLVDDSALNEAGAAQGSGPPGTAGDAGSAGKGAAGLHTRGLTLTQEWRALRSVVRLPQRGAAWATAPVLVDVGASGCEVTAILVLHGLPRCVSGAIVAHELMHAWLHLGGLRGLSADVEEGLCQLLALLWLEAQAPSPQAWEDRLSSFCGFQIRSHPSPVYGDGLRAALESFQAHGLPALLDSVRHNGTFACCN